MGKLSPEPKRGTECPKSCSGYHQWLLVGVKYVEQHDIAESRWVCRCGAIKRVRANEVIKEGFDKK